MQRVVLDPSVIVAALRSRTSAGFALLSAARHRRFTLLATSALFFEYEDVLKRDAQREASGLSLDDVDRLLGALAILVEPVEVHMRWRPQLRDPDDEMVLEAAINGRADALVTYNIRDFSDAAPRFGVRLLRPADMLKELSE